MAEFSRREILQAGIGVATTALVEPTVLDTRQLIGYGIVNRWHTIDAAKLAESLKHAACNFTEIEYVAWFDDGGRLGKSTVTKVDAARTFVNEMRKRGIKTMISVVNWNGEAQRAASDAWYLERLQEIKTRIGPKDVLLLPVSEPDGQQSGKAHRWAEMARQEWQGQFVGNGDGGRGEPMVAGFDYVDWHHCEDFTGNSVRTVTAGKPTINNTDCGPVLNPGPERTRRMARIALEKGTNLLIYGWKDDKIDETVIAALGDEVHRAMRTQEH